MTLQEKDALLMAWMEMAVCVRGNRLLSDLSMNEMLVCSGMIRAEQEDRTLTATDLCGLTKLLKSQMNKVLSEMESKGLVMRTRSVLDKRRVDLHLTEKGHKAYEVQHELVLEIVGQVGEALGDKANTLTVLMSKAAKTVDQYLDKQED